MPEPGLLGSAEVFVYYRAPVQVETDLCRAVAVMHRHLCTAHPGLQARLLRRPELRDGEITFMEVYACGERGVDAPLRAAIEAAAQGLAPWISGTRHTEVFLPCA